MSVLLQEPGMIDAGDGGGGGGGGGGGNDPTAGIDYAAFGVTGAVGMMGSASSFPATGTLA